MEHWKSRLPLAALTPFTLQDFPGKCACLLWFSGCQMNCPYCHNPDFARGKGERLDVDRILAFLRSRSPYLEGVALSGGECLLSPAMVPFLREIRAMGYGIKLDTNGASADRLAMVLEEGLCDYVAMDFKAPLGRYGEVTGWSDAAVWERSFDLLRGSDIDWELRCTVHVDLVDEASVGKMLDYLDTAGFGKTFYLQNYRHGETLGQIAAPSRRFDLARLDLKRGFSIGFRNFTENEAQQARRSAQEAEIV